MKEIVQKIIEAEKEIRDRIEEAKAESQKIVRGAEAKSREVIESGRQVAVQEGQQLIESLSREAEEERKKKVTEVSGGSDQVIRERSEGITAAVSRITKMVEGVME
ncbi:MAG TPA: hypothetical protein VLA34_06665 [Candidatus Krumholzibacterium sp.]|nr:hypothetical protein [Candidatus Krumholzibacterium sp.]